MEKEPIDEKHEMNNIKRFNYLSHLFIKKIINSIGRGLQLRYNQKYKDSDSQFDTLAELGWEWGINVNYELLRSEDRQKVKFDNLKVVEFYGRLSIKRTKSHINPIHPE